MLTLNLKNAASLSKRTSAFPYQLEAIEFVKNLPYAAIFFEQGLGKTKIAIDLTLDWVEDGVVDSVIVVTKKGLIQNWKQEFAVHSHVIPKIISSDRSANHHAFFSPSRVYLANYEAIALEEERIKIFSKQRKLAIILDESQKIKNPNSSLAKSFFDLTSYFYKKIIMTGTPMANRPYDIWSQIYFLDEGMSLGNNFSEFKNNLELPDHASNDYISALANVFPKISDFTLRQTKEGSGLDLPSKEYRVEFAEWESVQRVMYEKVRDELKIEIVRDGVAIVDDTETLLKRLLRLVQIASNPSVIDEAYTGEPGKLNATRSLIAKIISQNEKVIVWTSFVDNCRYLKENLSGYGSVQLHGKMAISDRNKSVEKFKNDENVKILVATPASAKEGLTLTVANHVLFYDRTFSLDDYVQAQDRIHRISQTKICHVYNLVLPNSIDEWVGALISLKSAASRFGMGDAPEEELNEALSQNITEVLKAVLEA